MSACPKCGSTAGYVLRMRVSGYVEELVNRSDSGDVRRLDAEDHVTYTRPKTARCGACGDRIPNPQGV